MHQFRMFNLAEQCVTQRVLGRTIIWFHIVDDIKSFVVEGFELIISIIGEDIQMVRVVGHFSMVGRLEAD